MNNTRTGNTSALETMAPALEGLRVVDLTQFEAGPSCTEALAWLGADVVKVERPVRGEQGRFASSEDPNVDSPYWMILNANKRSVTCDLKSEKGREVLKDMIRHGDIFIENFAPGTIERMGFSYEVVREINPRIIYAQIKGFGPGSPYENFLSFDVIGQAVGGIMSVTGDADGRPLKVGAGLGDTGTGLHCVIGILAAVIQRERTGQGQRIFVAQQDAMVNYCRISYGDQAFHNAPCPRRGNAGMLGMSAPCEVFRCKGDGPNDYCYVYSSRAAYGNVHWERILKTIGREDMIGDPRFATPQNRADNVELINAILAPWFLERTKREAMEILGKAGTPVGAVFDTMELSTDPYLRERGIFATVEHPVRGEFVLPGWPVEMSDSKVPVECPPTLGQHTADVFREWLGYSSEQIDELHEDGAI